MNTWFVVLKSQSCIMFSFRECGGDVICQLMPLQMFMYADLEYFCPLFGYTSAQNSLSKLLRSSLDSCSKLEFLFLSVSQPVNNIILFEFHIICIYIYIYSNAIVRFQFIILFRFLEISFDPIFNVH